MLQITETFESRPSPERQRYASLAHGAQFVEVKVDLTWGRSASVNPLVVKGMGEPGMVGIPAAIANAVFQATGRRIRELPITPEKPL